MTESIISAMAKFEVKPNIREETICPFCFQEWAYTFDEETLKLKEIGGHLDSCPVSIARLLQQKTVRLTFVSCLAYLLLEELKKYCTSLSLDISLCSLKVQNDDGGYKFKKIIEIIELNLSSIDSINATEVINICSNIGFVVEEYHYNYGKETSFSIRLRGSEEDDNKQIIKVF